MPERILLFGSYANNRATDYSDVDILVVANRFNTISYEKRLDVLYDLTTDLRPDFHVYGLTPKEYKRASPLTILGEIKKHGIDML